jgi:hypothetical protein
MEETPESLGHKREFLHKKLQNVVGLRRGLISVKFQKILPVLFIHEDGFSLIGPAGNVIDRSGVFYS